MVKTRMERTRIDQVGKAQLLDMPQSLEVRVVNDTRYKGIRNAYEPVHRVIDNLYLPQSFLAFFIQRPLICCTFVRCQRNRNGVYEFKNRNPSKLDVMEQIKILWADDEIDLLKPHIMFLEEKGYQVQTATSADEAVSSIQSEGFDVLFLDENMPGQTGLEVLPSIKHQQPDLPVIMITKSEEEFLMEDAIGSQISDYLIKPVNPKQILLSIKKQVDNKRLVSEKVTRSYQQDFTNLSMQVNEQLSADEWIDVYQKLAYWDIELEKSDEENMKEVLATQKTDANANFSRFVENNYLDWLEGDSDAPLMSHKLLKNKVLPKVSGEKPTFLILLDNFRYDQWKAIQPLIGSLFNVQEDTAYYSILPTATNFSRNAIFSGLLPSQIKERFPDKWVNDEEKGGKNLHESDFLDDYLKRLKQPLKYNYNKITNLEAGKSLPGKVNEFMNYDLNVIIYNFLDLMSHVRTEMEVLKELAEDEAAYRSLTVSWFEHSPLYEMLKELAQQAVNVVLTTDHGSIRVKHPSKVVGDRNTSTNLRYKQGKSLDFEKKEVFKVSRPEQAHLPKPHVSSSFIFAKDDHYFVYPNNYNYYVNFFKNTFQHGGVSLEEMIIPVVSMTSK